LTLDLGYISPPSRIILFWGNSQTGEDLKDHENVEQWDHQKMGGFKYVQTKRYKHRFSWNRINCSSDSFKPILTHMVLSDRLPRSDLAWIIIAMSRTWELSKCSGRQISSVRRIVANHSASILKGGGSIRSRCWGNSPQPPGHVQMRGGAASARLAQCRNSKAYSMIFWNLSRSRGFQRFNNSGNTLLSGVFVCAYVCFFQALEGGQ